MLMAGEQGASIQGCIDAASPGDLVQVPAGLYNESLTLDKAVSLVGLGVTASDTVVSAAALADRVLLVRGASVDETVVITNLTLSDGVASGSELIFRNGGGVLVFDGARPSIAHVVIRDNLADGFSGGGLWADMGSPLSLHGVVFLNNTAVLSGGGAAPTARSRSRTPCSSRTAAASTALVYPPAVRPP